MSLPLFLCVTVWLVATGGYASGSAPPHQYYLQDQRGGYKFGYRMPGQAVQGEVDPSSEMRGRYSYVDDQGTLRGVEYTAGVGGYQPRELRSEEMEGMDFHKQSVDQLTPDEVYQANERIKIAAQKEKQTYHDKNGDIKVEVETLNDEENEEPSKVNNEESKTRGDLEKEKTGIVAEPDVPTEEDEVVEGKYTITGEDGLAATIEYEAGPKIGFVVKSFTKESPTEKPVPDKVGETGDNIQPGLLKGELSQQTDELAKPSIDEGTEEMYPSGLVRGLYTYVEEDGVPATIEYEASPDMGFMVKKFSKGKVQLQQFEEEKGTAKNTMPQSYSLFSSAKHMLLPEINSKSLRDDEKYEQIDSLLSPIKVKHTPILLQPNPIGDSKIYLNDDSPQEFRATQEINSRNDEKYRSDSFPVVKSIKEEAEDNNGSANASYRFGFSVDDQSRHEESDAKGNVRGSYSYLDGGGLLTKVEYEAGAKKGFVIKRMTHEKSTDKKRDSDNTSSLDYEKSPIASKEYVDIRNIPIQYDSDQDTSDDSNISSSSKFYTIAVPDNYDNLRNKDYYYDPLERNQQSDFSTALDFSKPDSQYDNTHVKYNQPYSLYVKSDQISTPHQIYSSEIAEPYRNKLNRGFEVYGPPKIDLAPSFQVILDPDLIRRVVAEKANAKNQSRRKHSQHQKRKRPTKRPGNPNYYSRPTTSSPQETAEENFSGIKPDGSYAFAYKTKDHSRQQSVDADGNVHYSYRFNTKRDGNTVVIFSSKVAKDPAEIVKNKEEVYNQ